MGRYSRHQEQNDEPVFYCSHCLSLNIIRDKKGVLICKDCNSGPHKLDITTIERYERLYKELTGHWPMEDEPSAYDDLFEAYSEDTPSVITAEEALANGSKVRDVMNKNWGISQKPKNNETNEGM